MGEASLKYKFKQEVGADARGRITASFEKSAGMFSTKVPVDLSEKECLEMHEKGLVANASTRDIENSNEASDALVAIAAYKRDHNLA